MSDLLPCPAKVLHGRMHNFLGEPTATDAGGYWRVECPCGVKGPLADTQDEAERLWNEALNTRQAAPVEARGEGLTESALFRPCIHNLAVEMEAQLQRNESRGGWNGMSVPELQNRIDQNLNDLSNLQPGTIGFTRTCADIANFAAMLLENNPQKYVPAPVSQGAKEDES